MENDIKQLMTERDIWSSAAYELALKVGSSGNITQISFFAWIKFHFTNFNNLDKNLKNEDAYLTDE